MRKFVTIIPKKIDNKIVEVEMFYFYKKIKNKVYQYYSFSHGATWEIKLMPYKELPYVELSLPLKGL